ncbi:MAG: DNA-binding protein [Acidaminococcaceae bacterium]|nr:DNA-binding protein [Acidaminococcaceae bacterium]HBX74674.1 DNA-binding protein [Acidaminococcaceae bacterium]
MEFQKFGDTYVVRLDKGEEIVASLQALCEKQQIALASVEGIGAADHAVIGLYDVGRREYHKTELDGPMEITSLMGNITQKDGAVYIHLHINLCNKEMQILGGHLNECSIGATGEVFVRVLPGNVGRRLDEEVTGLNLFHFV